MKLSLFVLFLVASIQISAFAQKYYTPKSGSAERKEIMDALRPEFEKYFGVQLKFVVDEFKVLFTSTGSFVWITFEPSNPKTNKLYDISETILRDKSEEFDSGLKTYAILKKVNKTWKVVNYVCSPTDVPWVCWWKEYSFPKEIFTNTAPDC